MLLTAAFIVMAILVVTGITLPIDDAILRAIGRHRTDGLTSIMRLFSTLGHGDVEIPLALSLVGFLWWKGERGRARAYLIAAMAGELFYVGLKAAFHRPRPDVIPALYDAGWYSFPSGHAMLAPVIYTFGFVLLSRTVDWGGWRRGLLGLAFVVPYAIAISRVYLGVHYPSDVVAGLLIGSAWAILWSDESSRPSALDTSSAPTTR